MGAFKLNNSKESWEIFLEAVRGKTLMNDRYMSAFFRDFPEGVQLVISIILNFFNPDPDTMNYDILANKAKMIKNIKRGSDSMQIVREYLTEEDWNAAIKEGKKQENNRGISILCC